MRPSRIAWDSDATPLGSRVAGRALTLCVVAAVFLAGVGVSRAATVAGTTPGALSVDRTGAATYQIPIQVPPGTAGIEPSLSLVYNSHQGNGSLGVGWALAGLSAIDRCPRTEAQDGVHGGIGYDSNDRFCLDGERLMVVAGTYGADGAEYRTEVESFARLTSHGTAGSGPAWFEVETKSGNRIEFGNTADSRIEGYGRDEARRWALNRITDSAGNYMTVSYVEKNGQVYPDRIGTCQRL